MFARLIAVACLGLTALPALATETTTTASPAVENAWSRAMPPMAPTGAAYFVLSNPGETADRLIGARTPQAQTAELHTHIHADGVMRMEQVPAIDLPAGGRVEFRPGGYHVMMFGLTKPLVAGERFELTLELENAGEITTEVEVRDQPPAMHQGHMMDMGGHSGHMQH